jgi:hypothetical protein
MTRMLDIPRDRPRRSRWIPPLLLAMLALFYIGLQSDPKRQTSESGKPATWSEPAASRIE